MRKMKAITLMVFLLVLSIGTMACSGKSAQESNAPSQTPEPTAAAQETPAPSEEPKIDLQGATIKIASYYELDPAKTEVQTEVTELKAKKIKEVEAKYNVKIEFVTVPYTEMLTKLTATALSGDPVGDLVRIDAKWLPSLVSGGYVKALKDITDLSDERFTDAIKKNGTYNGVQYGFLENIVDGAGLFYNKEIIKREGLEDPAELMKKGEWTWDKMMEMAKAATKSRSGDGKIDQWGISAYQPTLATFMILSNGTTIFDDENGQVNLDHPNALEALEMLNTMYNKDKVVLPPEGDSYQQARTEFAAGKVLFTVGSTWEGNTRLKPEQMADDWGYIFFPKGPKADDYVTPQTDTNMYFVTSGSKYPSEVIEIWKETVAWDMLDQDFDDFMDWAFRHDADKEVGKSMPAKSVHDYYNGFSELETLYNQAIGKITRGEAPPATAIESIKAQAQAAIDAVLKK